MRGALVVAAALALLAGAGADVASAESSVPTLASLAPHAPLATGFHRPRGVAVASSGAVYFTDEEEGRVYEVIAGGAPRVVVGGVEKPRGIALEDDGHLLLVAEKSGPHDAGPGGVLLRVEVGTGAVSVLARGIKHPRGLVRVADGSVYVTGDGLRRPGDDDHDDDDGDDDHGDNDDGDSFPGTVLRLGAGGLAPVVTGFKRPDGILASTDGSLLVAAEGYRSGGTRLTASVFAVSPAGAVSARVAEALKKTGGLVADVTGALFVGGKRDGGHAGGAIVKRSDTGQTNDLATGLRRPAGLALAPRGDLIAADADTGIVWRFTAPAPPTLDSPDPAFSSHNPFELSGTATAGTQVVVIGGSQRVTATPASDGSFTANVPLPDNQESALRVVAVGAAGRALASSPAELRVVHDNVPPQITAAPDRPPNAAGWYRADVAVAFACSDGGSGIATCPAPVQVSTEGAAQPVSGTATDRAGNTATATLAVSLDKTPPAVVTSASPPANADGWNNADVTVSFTCSDALSEIETCPAPVTVAGEGAGQAVSGTAADRAGNTASASITLSIDRTPPTITAVTSPAANPAGWNNSDVTVSFTCSDGGSSVASCPTPVTVATEGANQTVPGTAADRAGNTASTSVTLNIDKTPPTITASASPPANANGWNNTDVTVTFDAQDALSGLAGSSSPVTITTEGAAQFVSGTATDRAGNVATAFAIVSLDKTAPVVTIRSPIQGAIRRAPLVEVTGTVSDTNGIPSVSVNGIDAGAPGAFSAVVPLEEGSQTLTATAQDIAGNTGTAGVSVIYQSPPVIRITSPANLSAFGTTPITVSGTLDDATATVRVGLQGVVAEVSGNTFTASGVHLQEGGNVTTAVATDSLGNSGIDSITVVLDTQAPRVMVDSPTPGSVTTEATISVSGRVNDVVIGTINAPQAQVTVNGAPATVSYRTFLAEGVALVLGQNTITVTAADAVGNVDTKTITVFRETATGPRIQAVSGGGQTVGIGETLSQPLIASVADDLGSPLAGRTVIFRVAHNNGTVTDAQGGSARGVATLTDAQGRAETRFTLGTRAGAGNNRVEATSPGIVGAAVFTASATPHPPTKINVDSGANQKGAIGQPLPKPFVAVVTDEGHNRLGAIPVIFTVVEGGGDFNGQDSLTVETDSDGRALAVLTLGPDPGVENNVVAASVDNLAGLPAAFAASGLEPGDPSQTRISGVVLDNTNLPIPGVTLRIRGTALAATADAQGQFAISGVPVGDVDLLVDGSTAQRSGTWPSLEYEVVTVPGADNTLGMPIYLLPLDTASGIFVDETNGGTLTLPDFPGFSLTVAPNSATFPDGTRRGTITVTAVHVDRVPMVPNFGQQPRFIVTIQPPGVHFDPPAQVTHPNVDGLAPGEVTELYSFDHDMGSFVATGTATVSEDGLVLRSDSGTGILKGGWHCGGNPAVPGVLRRCGECQEEAFGRCIPLKRAVTITKPPDNPAPAEATWATNYSFLSTSTIEAEGGVDRPTNKPLEWEVIPDAGQVTNEIPADRKGFRYSFQPDPPPHPPYTLGGGSGSQSRPLSYEIRASLCKSKATAFIAQDQRDTIRQEYVNHAITIPDRSSFAAAIPTVHFFPAQINTTAYSVILGQPGLLAEAVRAQYNVLIAAAIGVPGPTDFGLVLNSGWRNPEKNEAVKGAQNSRHQFGGAVDLKLDALPPGITRTDAWCVLEAAGDAVGLALPESTPGTVVDCGDENVTHVHVQN